MEQTEKQLRRIIAILLSVMLVFSTFIIREISGQMKKADAQDLILPIMVQEGTMH